MSLKLAYAAGIVLPAIARLEAARERRHIMTDGERKKGGGNSRAARLEAELRANLKKRKEQARARARTTAADRPERGVGGASVTEGAE